MSTHARVLSQSIFVGFLLIVMSLFLAHPAQAHDEIIAMTPGSEEQVDAAPSQIVLEYSNNLVELGNVVMIRDADDYDWAEGDVTVKNNALIQEVQQDAPDGWYRVDWRAVSSDGHPITGTYLYLVGDNPDLPKPQALEEFQDDHHDGADSDAVQDGGAEGEGSSNQALIMGSLVAAGIGVGLIIVLLQARKKKQS